MNIRPGTMKSLHTTFFNNCGSRCFQPPIPIGDFFQEDDPFWTTDDVFASPAEENSPVLYNYVDENDWNIAVNRCEKYLSSGEYEKFLQVFKEDLHPSQRHGYLSNMFRNKHLPHTAMKPLFTFLGVEIDWVEEEHLFQVYQRVLEQDDVETLIWILSERADAFLLYQELLESALFRGAVRCLAHLVTLEYLWELTSNIALIWASQQCGEPNIDQCIALIAPLFLPPAVLENLDPFATIPYPEEMTLDLIAGEKPGRSGREAISYLLATTPFMRHSLQTSQLTQQNTLDLALALEQRAQLILSQEGRFEGDKVHCSVAGQSFTIWDNPGELEQVVETLHLLLTQHPKILRRQGVRCTVVALALVAKPDPRMVEWAQKLPGKQLVICNYNFPWFILDFSGNLETDYNPSYFVATTGAIQEVVGVSGLMAQWETRMPSHLYPVIHRDKFPFNEPAMIWLEYCKVIGEPKSHELSTLGYLLVQYDYDHPVFLDALKPGGVLEVEREAYFHWLSENGEKRRGHYLMSISLLGKENNYAL